MNADFVAVLWKEWKEIVMERSAGSTGSFRPLILIAVFGIFVPFRMGPERFFSAVGLLAPTFFSAVVITTVIADSSLASGNGTRSKHCSPAASRTSRFSSARSPRAWPTAG
jgi:hypothetical protein